MIIFQAVVIAVLASFFQGMSTNISSILSLFYYQIGLFGSVLVFLLAIFTQLTSKIFVGRNERRYLISIYNWTYKLVRKQEFMGGIAIAIFLTH